MSRESSVPDYFGAGSEAEGADMPRRGVLERFSVLRATDIDAFRASVSRALTPHRLTPLGRDAAAVHTDVAVASLGPISLVYGHHRGAELRAELTELVDYFDVNLSWGGSNRISCDGDEVVVDRHTAGIISPRMQAQMHLSAEYRQMHVRIERHALDRQLEQMLGRPVVAPVRFRSTMDLRAPAATSWARAVRLLVDDLDQGTGLSGHALGPNPWSTFLMSGLLLAQPHNYSGQLEETRRGPHRPAPTKVAIDLIESRPDTDLSVERLAREAGVSPRSLQRHFRDYVGVSPREYVQQVRLARVHEDLLAARPGGGVTVADTALRWGFSHVPRFAGSYQDRYGETPSVTLRRLPPQPPV
ncbi:AraC family transcriptional regulator [Modestobacter excelsi]|uniref:AraC family transcriptional regulator n=1 Tax=Modestobacter excelsi TaxID=2213161 RepID=UPI001C20C88C|nr:AraC family transcriptional regulator [Modestobacter excelsi]